MKLIQVSICVILFISCQGGLSTSNLEALLDKNENQLKEVAHQFLKHKEIEWIIINNNLDSSNCQSVNEWSNCPTMDSKWKTWSDSLQNDIYLNSITEVLKYENIDSGTYNYFHDFLKYHDLLSISRGYFECENCVEFESYRSGLRYYTVQPNDLEENYEYLYVKRINANWFVYTRDWN